MTRALLTALLLATATTAHAGDKPLQVIFVNMTPDAASSAASKQCVRALEKKIAADYTDVVRLGETALRKKAGKTAGEPFRDWPAAALAPVKDNGPNSPPTDAVILVDCRPEERRLEILVNPATGGKALIELHGIATDRPAVELVADAVLRRAWRGAIGARP